MHSNIIIHAIKTRGSLSFAHKPAARYEFSSLEVVEGDFFASVRYITSLKRRKNWKAVRN